MVTVIAMEVLPEERDRKYYADNYSCCPPPLFVIFVTLVEVSLYIFTLCNILSGYYQSILLYSAEFFTENFHFNIKILINP